MARSEQPTDTERTHKASEKDILHSVLEELIAEWRKGFLSPSKPVKFQEFLTATGQFLDEHIRLTQRQKNLAYVGGNLILLLGENDVIDMRAEFYYQDRSEQWVKESLKNKTHREHFEDWDTSADLKTLRTNGKIEYPILPPEKE
jgi:hypothetical protein